MNGGPGCSSMDGFFYEQGPVNFCSSDPENLTLCENPWTWTRIANMIFLEAPAGVGFSYSNTPSDYNTDDNITAMDNHRFLQLWFREFPQFASNPFWISGESYAGIYVPTLANLVMQDTSINFQGVMVGNGVTDENYDGFMTALGPFAYGHGMISTDTWTAIEDNCPNDYDGDVCQNALNAFDNNFNDIDIYDIYSDCYHQRPVASHVPRSSKLQAIRDHKLGISPPCINSDKATTYLNMPSVQKAIHVQQGINWTICTEDINYNSNTNSVIPIYKELLKSQFKVLIYSGDTDGAVPYTGTAAWTESLNLPVITSWTQWSIVRADGAGDQVAGFITEYDGLTFLTVKGSGHMVPQFKPEAAFNMFQTFVTGGSFN